MPKIPIFTATKSLDVRYTFDYGMHEHACVNVSGAHNHALLYAGYNGLISTRASMGCYTASIEDINIATASVTLLYTDTFTAEGYLGEEIQQNSFFIKATDHEDQILSSHDFYTEEKAQSGVTPSKAGRDATFNKLLMQRVSAFSGVSSQYDPPSNAVVSPSALEAEINGPMFHETFHHSEQALMHSMSTARGLSILLKTIVHNTKAAYLYGIVLDIFTQRMLCGNCNCSLLGMQQSHEDGFLHDLSESLTKKHIQPAEGGVMLDVRVSAKQPSKSGSMEVLKLPSDAHIVHEYNPKAHIPRVLQAENKALGTTKLIKDKIVTWALCQSTFFVSSTFPKIKLEARLRDIRNTSLKSSHGK